MRKPFLAFLLMLICSPLLAKEKFFILPEDNISVQAQLNSIFLQEGLNSNSILKKVFKLNRLKSNEFQKLNRLKKIRIPTPLKQKSCNFSRAQSGLVIFRELISFEDQRKQALKKKSNQCNYYRVYQNYIVKKKGTALSSILYSIFLTPVWKKNGLIQRTKNINGITTNKELETRTNFFIPSVALAKGCNFYRVPTGKVIPMKLILNATEKEEFSLAFQCAEALPLGEKEEPQPEPIPEPKQPPPPPEKPHYLELHAVTNLKFGKSDVSDVEVDILSAYGVGINYHYILNSKRRINLNTQFEYYTEVKNRELLNNFTWKKQLNYEVLYTEKKDYGFTAGLYEQWYFENIEVDDFVFTSSLLPYLGLTLHKTFKQKFILDTELGAFPSFDLLGRDIIKYGVFFNNFLKFPLFGYDLSIGANIDYTVFERSTTRNISLVGGLSYNF